MVEPGPKAEAGVRASSSGARGWRFRLFIALALAVITAIGWAGLQIQALGSTPPANPTLQALATSLSFTLTPSPSASPSPPGATLTAPPDQEGPLGTLFYTTRIAAFDQIWAFLPDIASPVPITFAEANSKDPALSPNGELLAFASDRTGFWELYLLHLRTLEIRQLTATADYEAHPTWSPDGRWLAYEAYSGSDLDIWILAIDGGQPPIQLTNHPGMDVAPSWDPRGRRIAFISDRDGSADVFMADLDRPDDRYTNLTRTADQQESDPVFRPDGGALAFSSRNDGLQLLTMLDLDTPNRLPTVVGQGNSPAWSPSGDVLVAVLETPNSPHLVWYDLNGESAPISGLLSLNGVIDMVWVAQGLAGAAYQAARSAPSPEPLFQEQSDASVAARDRLNLVTLPGISAPTAALSDAVDDAFMALHAQTNRRVGWNFLGSLEYAFVGLNDPLPPGYAYNDWLYTGRAFSIDPAAVSAGWVEVVREDISGQTYWRIFVRASMQDGSLGQPLRVRPWDFSTRLTGDPQAYDAGGSSKPEIPSGYYVDFTQLAADYGFARVAALPNWRTYYSGARFGEFVRTDGLDWQAAMLQLYPASAIATPTVYQTPTSSPTVTPSATPTPWWWRWRTPTPGP